MTEDRSPIADRGEIEQRRGLAGLFGGADRSIPAPEPGQRLVLVGRDGGVTTGEPGRSAGERHRDRPHRWLLVDEQEHQWTFPIAFADTATTAGFVATVSVTASVRDPLAVARKGVDSFTGHLEPALTSAVAGAAAVVGDDVATGPDPVKALTDARKRVLGGLRDHLGARLDTVLPEWLSARVTSVTIDFDAATRRHYDDLVERARLGHVIEADNANDERRDKGEIARRGRWRAALGDAVANPILGLLEVAAADPSRDNIASVSAHVLQLYRDSAEHGRETMLELIRNDHLDETGPLYASLMKTLEGAMPNLLPGAAPAPGLNVGTTPQIDAPEDAPEDAPGPDAPDTVDGEAHTQVWSDS
jgi:hypothetical protein